MLAARLRRFLRPRRSRRCWTRCCRRFASAAATSSDEPAACARLLARLFASSPRRFARAAACRSPSDLGAGALCGACLRRGRRATAGPGRRWSTTSAAAGWSCRSSTATAPTWRAPCGAWMARAGAELLAEADLVAPVPLHWRRLFMRRYNQAQLLARAAVAAAPAPTAARLVPDLLRRRALDGLAGRARRRGERRRQRCAARSTSIRAGRPRWPARACCWSTTC